MKGEITYQSRGQEKVVKKWIAYKLLYTCNNKKYFKKYKIALKRGQKIN